jgi:hypothetical protein
VLDDAGPRLRKLHSYAWESKLQLVAGELFLEGAKDQTVGASSDLMTVLPMAGVTSMMVKPFFSVGLSASPCLKIC